MLSCAGIIFNIPYL